MGANVTFAPRSLAFFANYTIVTGSAANQVKVSVQTLPNIEFKIWVSATSTGGANWNDVLAAAGDLIPGMKLAGQLDSPATGAANVPIGRGRIIGIEFTLCQQSLGMAFPKASLLTAISDSNGFVDVEISSSVKATCFVNAGVPGILAIQSRQIVAGDYA
jgi:hypothetical protein